MKMLNTKRKMVFLSTIVLMSSFLLSSCGRADNSSESTTSMYPLQTGKPTMAKPFRQLQACLAKITAEASGFVPLTLKKLLS